MTNATGLSLASSWTSDLTLEKYIATVASHATIIHHL